MLSNFLGVFLLCSKIVDFSHTGLVLCPVNIAQYFFSAVLCFSFRENTGQKTLSASSAVFCS